MRARNIGISLLASIAVAIPFGCGDDEGDDPPESSASAERVDFLRQAGAACTTYLEERAVNSAPLEGLISGNLAKATPAEARAAADTLAEVNAINDELLTELRAIPPPPGDEEEIAAALDTIENAFATFEEATKSARQGDVEAMARGYEDGTKQLQEVASVAGDTGFAFCG